jgi:hypothetical protein
MLLLSTKQVAIGDRVVKLLYSIDGGKSGLAVREIFGSSSSDDATMRN